MAIKLLMPADKNKAMLKESVSTCFPRCEPIVVRVCVCVCVCVCVWGGGGEERGGRIICMLRYDTIRELYLYKVFPSVN